MPLSTEMGTMVTPLLDYLYTTGGQNLPFKVLRHFTNLVLLSIPSFLLPTQAMEGGSCERELQLLPRHSAHFPVWTKNPRKTADPPDHPHLDLNLSIGILPPPKPPSDEDSKSSMRRIQALKWHAAEQIRLAAVEKAYAEQVRELTRREMESAEKEFARARLVWERAREEVDKAERMKELATRRINSTCTEVTCQSCRQRFRP